jgi:hypothetical protein
MSKAAFLLVFIVLSFSTRVFSLPMFDSKMVGFYPISNNVSFFQNVDDSGHNRGKTLQVVSINTLKILTRFDFEFCGDFNWDMSCKKYDYYMELGVVKPVVSSLSVNYQRVISTFENKPVNQFGLRFSF